MREATAKRNGDGLAGALNRSAEMADQAARPDVALERRRQAAILAAAAAGERDPDRLREIARATR